MRILKMGESANHRGAMDEILRIPRRAAFQNQSGAATEGWEIAAKRRPGFWVCPVSKCGMHLRRERGGAPSDSRM